MSLVMQFKIHRTAPTCFDTMCFILRELIVSTLLSYISMSMESLVIQFKTSLMTSMTYLCNLARYCL